MAKVPIIKKKVIMNNIWLEVTYLWDVLLVKHNKKGDYPELIPICRISWMMDSVNGKNESECKWQK